MQRGSLIIYDNEGTIFLNTGDAEGDILPHAIPTGLPYIITEFGQLKDKIIKSVDVKKKQLILEDIPKVETEEKKLNKELLKAKSTIVDLQYRNLLNKKEEKVGK